MGGVNSSFVQVHPSYTMPDIIVQQSQASGFMRSFGGGKPITRLSEGDLVVYLKQMQMRSKAASGNIAYNMLPSISVAMSQISTPTYLIRNRAEYDHHDTAAASNWGYGLPEAYRLGSRQGIFQYIRGMALYGVNPANGEGLLNTPGATAIPLPADSNGNTTLATYDNGQLGIFFAQQVAALLIGTFQSGQKVHISILGPQRILTPMMLYNVVQLTQFQRVGAGTTTSAGLVSNLSEESGYTISWDFDDTLQGKGGNGADAVLFTLTEIETASGNPINTNEFAKLTPNLAANTLMLNDMPAPREIPTPIAGGAMDVLYEMRSTCGWGIRPEAIRIVSIFP